MAKKKSKKADPKQPNLEEALAGLERIVHDLEEGDLSLNEALAQYEEGVKLLRQSYDLLQRAERHIELLSGVDSEGNPITQPFDDRPTLTREEAPSESPDEGLPEQGSKSKRRKPRPPQTDMDTPGGLF